MSAFAVRPLEVSIADEEKYSSSSSSSNPLKNLLAEGRKSEKVCLGGGLWRGKAYLLIDNVRIEIEGGRAKERRERARSSDLQIGKRLNIPIPSDLP